jgi:Skp family chaperone for outer membrane proteins
MKKSLLILFLIIAVGFIPGMLFAQSSQDRSAAGIYGSGTDMDKSASKDTTKKGHEEWQARHKQFQQELKAMDQRLDDKIAAMNAAQGDQKIAAMSEVINEFAAQRKEFEHMFKSVHGQKMAHRGRGSADTGPMMRDSEGTSSKDMRGMHQNMGAPKQDMFSPGYVD